VAHILPSEVEIPHQGEQHADSSVQRLAKSCFAQSDHDRNSTLWIGSGLASQSVGSSKQAGVARHQDDKNAVLRISGDAQHEARPDLRDHAQIDDPDLAAVTLGLVRTLPRGGSGTTRPPPRPGYSRAGRPPPCRAKRRRISTAAWCFSGSGSASKAAINCCTAAVMDASPLDRHTGIVAAVVDRCNFRR